MFAQLVHDETPMVRRSTAKAVEASRLLKFIATIFLFLLTWLAIDPFSCCVRGAFRDVYSDFV